MNTEKMNHAVSMVANFGVTAGILFLGFELRQNTQATQLAAAQGALSSSFELDLRIAENPEIADLLVKADQSETLTGVELFRLDRWAYSGLRNWENTLYILSASALDERFGPSFKREIQRIVTFDPFIADFWQTNKSSFSQAFNDEFEVIVREARRE